MRSKQTHNADAGNKGHEWAQIPPLILAGYFVIAGSCVSKDAGMQHPVSGALQPTLGEPLLAQCVLLAITAH